MSLCHKTYRRYASIALVLALVLIALPSMLNAQTAAPKAPTAQSSDDFPKVELFVGYQWLNPGGNIPDQSTPPNAINIPSLARGLGANVSYNFTKSLALEANYGVNWNSGNVVNINMGAVGPKLTWRGENVDFFVHTLFGFEHLRSTIALPAPASPRFWAAAWISSSGSGSRSACLKPTSNGRTKALPAPCRLRIPGCAVRATTALA